MNAKKIFSHPLFSTLLALLVCALWGSLFPCIKLGYTAAEVNSGHIPSVMLFAGTRFAVSGIIMILLFSLTEKKPLLPQKKDLPPILGVMLAGIVLHYSFTYIALSIGEGSKSAIIKQVGFLFLSCLSFLVVKEERFSVRKILCGILGFAGIVITNLDGNGFHFALGDVLLIAASFCSVTSTVITKKGVKKTSPLILVAYSQLFGGILLTIGGVALGGKFMKLDLDAFLVFSYICLASITAYALWNVLIKYNSIAKLSIIKFTEPLFAVILSGILLRENIWRINYLLALIVIAAAILIVNVKTKGEKA